jgi:hypothetical protein
MEKKSLKHTARHLFSHVPGHVVLGGVGSAQQSPFLSRLFDPSTTSLTQFFNAAFKTALVIGAMLAVLRLGYAGFVYLTSDLPGSKGNARTIISEAVLGLLLLLAVWLILNQINPQILNLNILQNVRPSSAAPSSLGSKAPSAPSLQPFTMPPAPNSFVGGAGGQFDPTISGMSVGGGCDGAC